MISPDLTRNDPRTLGAVRRPDHAATTPAPSTTARSSPSPNRRVQQGVLWAGSDDGLVHVSRDGGDIVAERHAAGLAGVGADLASSSRRRTMPAPPTSPRTRYKLDDFAPYLYKTTDYGTDLDEDHRRHPGRRLHARRSARTQRGGGCSTPAPRPASTSRSTMARTGSACRAICRSCRSTTSS